MNKTTLVTALAGILYLSTYFMTNSQASTSNDAIAAAFIDARKHDKRYITLELNTPVKRSMIHVAVRKGWQGVVPKVTETKPHTWHIRFMYLGSLKRLDLKVIQGKKS